MSPMMCGYLLINTPPATMFYALCGLTAVGGGLRFLAGRGIH